MDAAAARDDQPLLINIKGVDMIAKEAKYHRKCRSKYVSKTNLKYQGYKEDNEEEECVYSAAFALLVDEITPALSEGKIYDMSYLLDRYKQVLVVKGVSCSTYRSEKLKRRMRNHFLDQIVIEKQNDPSMPELIYSSHLSVADIVKTSVSHQSTSQVENAGDEDTKQDMEQDKAIILYRTAQIIKNDIKQCKGLSIKPLSEDDVSTERGRCLIPQSLYSFLSEVISRQEKKSPTTESDGSTFASEKERRTVMLGQDIIHAATNSQVKTPKLHIGLAVTVHHLTGSKEVVTLSNRMGHCSSYDDVEIENTAWAREMEARSQQTGVVIPSNIIPGPFVQFAADNNDFNEETLDGKQTTHSTTLVVYQRQPFGPKPPPKIHADHTSRRRSLEQPVQGPLIHECSVRGKRPPLMSFVGRAEESFVLDEDSTAAENLRELAWFLLRLNRKDVFKADDTCGEQSIPGWSAFNAMTSSITLPRTVIGYYLMIAGSPTEYSTIYTVLKTVQEMSKQLHQNTAVITFDLAIYSKAKEIQLRYPEEFQHLVIRLGGFHIALNYLALIRGCFYRVWSLWIELDYGASTRQIIQPRNQRTQAGDGGTTAFAMRGILLLDQERRRSRRHRRRREFEP